MIAALTDTIMENTKSKGITGPQKLPMERVVQFI